MATYYVSPQGSNISPYDTWAKAANQPSSVVALAPPGGPHTVYLAPGVYQSVHFSNAVWAGSKWAGTAAHGSILPASRGQVILNRTTDAPLRPEAASSTVSWVSVTGGIASTDLIVPGANDILLEGVVAYNAPRRCLSTFNIANLKLKGCRLEGSAGTSQMFFSGTSSVTFEDSISSNGTSFYASSGSNITLVGSSSLDLVNSIINGQLGAGIDNAGTGALNIKNSIVQGGSNLTSATPIYKGTAVLNIENSLIGQTWYSKTLISGTPTVDLGNIKTLPPKFKRHQRRGFIIPCIDDIDNPNFAASSGYVSMLESLLSDRGMSGQWYVEGAKVQGFSDRIAFVQSVQNSGKIKIGVHSFSHSDIGLTGDTFSISKSGHTINIDRETNQIIVAGADPITVLGFKQKTLAAIRAELIAGGCTLGAVTTNLSTSSLGESIADSSGAQASPYTPQLLIDSTATTGYLNVEVVQAKAVMESSLGFPMNVFAPPLGSSTLTAETATINAGFKATRPGLFETRVSPQHLLQSLNIYKIGYIPLSSVIKGANNAETLINIRAMCEMIAQYGAIIPCLAHSLSEFSQEEWILLLDTAKNEYPEITVCDMETAVNWIKANGTTSDNLTYNYTFTDQSDYHLQPTSPCIGAGTAIAGITTDIEGNQLYPPYNIGPYGAAEGALETGASDHTGQAKLSFAAVSNPTDTTFADAHTYKLADSHQMRSVTGWEYWTENTFYNADGTPKTLTGAALKAAGVGPLLWIGDSKWMTFKSTAEAKRALKVPVA